MANKELTTAQKIRKIEIADNLNYWIKLRHITARELADKTGISFSSISAYRNGRGNLSHFKAQQLAKVLNCSPDDIDPTYEITSTPTKNPLIFMKNIQALMIKKGETLPELASAIDYSVSSIEKWKNGDMLPSIQAIHALANHFNISPEELVGDNFEIAVNGKLSWSQQKILAKIPDDLSEEDIRKISDYINLIKNAKEKEKN